MGKPHVGGKDQHRIRVGYATMRLSVRVLRECAKQAIPAGLEGPSLSWSLTPPLFKVCGRPLGARISFWILANLVPGGRSLPASFSLAVPIWGFWKSVAAQPTAFARRRPSITSCCRASTRRTGNSGLAMLRNTPPSLLPPLPPC